jgi:hypothetical protein
MIAPIKAEYLASGPNVPTAWDSTDPGVSENRVWDAISGIKGPLNVNLRINAMAIATAPVQRPTMNDNLMERCLIMQSLSYLSQLRFKFFPRSSQFVSNSYNISVMLIDNYRYFP